MKKTTQEAMNDFHDAFMDLKQEILKPLEPVVEFINRLLLRIVERLKR
ncbi:hypothetical protein KAR91_04120 [Candidatus Pacearchaeota archaeon]|nr:hypothetical protein [Candidatus Pacearchaeota archaeon]